MTMKRDQNEDFAFAVALSFSSEQVILNHVHMGVSHRMQPEIISLYDCVIKKLSL